MSIKLAKLLLLIFLCFFIIFDKASYRTFFLIEDLKSFRSIKKYCIVIVFGTRPEAIKMIPIIKKLKNNRKFLCITIKR